MSRATLQFIDAQLTYAGINYEFCEWTSDVVYPYFVGEYTDVEPISEDGLQESDFKLTGFSRGSWLELETAKETIESLFSNCTTILSNGSGVDVSYSGALIVPTGDAELKRIEINLHIKEWKVD